MDPSKLDLSRSRLTRGSVRLWCCRLLAPAMIAGVSAEAGAQRPRGSGDGYLFSPPVVSFTVRGGYDFAAARSDIYSFTTKNLTLNRGDFAALGVNVDINVPLSPRTELVFTGGLARRSAPSEFRKYIDNNDLPIEQTTTLSRAPVSVGVRYALKPAGEQISALAWIPSRFTPWVGAGVGAMQWRFKQVGDFVNFQTLDVFPSTLSSSGWAPMGYANVSADYSLSKRVVITSDLRYTYARGSLAGQFENFNKIDLSGAAATMGLSLRY